VTTDGLPLGLAAAKFWNRKKFKGTAALKRKVNKHKPRHQEPLAFQENRK
jgi:hypothetical protein